MTGEDREAVRRLAAKAPPLTDAQRALIRAAMRHGVVRDDL